MVIILSYSDHLGPMWLKSIPRTAPLHVGYRNICCMESFYLLITSWWGIGLTHLHIVKSSTLTQNLQLVYPHLTFTHHKHHLIQKLLIQYCIVLPKGIFHSQGFALQASLPLMRFSCCFFCHSPASLPNHSSNTGSIWTSEISDYSPSTRLPTHLL